MIKKLYILLLGVSLFISKKVTAQDIDLYKNNAEKLKALISTTKDEKLKADALNSLGQYYQDNAIFDTAITYKLEAIGLQKKGHKQSDTTNSYKIGTSLMGIVRLYLSMGLPEQAKQYAEEAIPYIKNNSKLQVLYYKNMADALRMYAQAGAKNISEAKLYYDSLTNFCKEVHNDNWKHRIAIDLSFTDYYLSKNDADTALQYINAAQQLAPQWADTTLNSQIIYMAGNVYLTKQDYAGALPYLKSAEKFAEAWGPDLYVNLLKNLADAYGETGNYKEAFKYYKKYVPLRDTVYVKATERSFAEAEAKFQNKEKQQQIENKNLQLKVGRNKILWLIAGLALLALVAFLLLLNNRNKKKTATLLNEKNIALANLNTALEDANQTKAKLFSIIGHDLRSPISQVYQFLKLQQLNPEMLDEEQKNKLSHKIQTATGSLLETMEDLLLWSKTQMNEFKTNIQIIKILPVIESCKNLLQLNSDAKNITYKNLIASNEGVTTDAYYLQTIFRNLLQNAIKASPDNSEIEIGVNNTTNNNIVYIKNKGETFTQQQYQQILSSEDDAKSLNGLGLRLVDELSKKIGVVVEFSSTQNDSTLVEVHIPKL